MLLADDFHPLLSRISLVSRFHLEAGVFEKFGFYAFFALRNITLFFVRFLSHVTSISHSVFKLMTVYGDFSVAGLLESLIA